MNANLDINNNNDINIEDISKNLNNMQEAAELNNNVETSIKLAKDSLVRKSVKFKPDAIKKLSIMSAVWEIDYNDIIQLAIDELYNNKLYSEITALKSNNG